MDKEANLLALGSFLVVSAGLTLFHTFPKDPLDISSVMFTVAGSHLQKHTWKDKNYYFPFNVRFTTCCGNFKATVQHLNTLIRFGAES